MSNIVQVPDALERRAQKIEAAMARREHGRTEWIEGTIELAIELAGARADHGGDDRKFGQWLNERFTSASIPANERAILIREGREPEKMRAALETTKSKSIQLIFTNASKDHSAPALGARLIKAAKEANAIARGEKPSPVRESAKVAIREHKATTGDYPSRLDAFKKYGVSSIVFERAIGEVTTEDKAATAPILQFTKAQERDIEARVEARRRELQASFEHAVREKVRATLNEILATRDAEDAEAVRRANEIIMHSSARAPFTAGEYTGVLLRALHPDTTTPENRTEAFKLVNSRKVLLRAEGRIEIRGRIPAKSAEEWEARKRAAALARKRKPAASS